MKAGLILKQNNEIFTRSMKRPIKINPFYVEDEELKYQRREIIKAYETFQNEKQNNYIQEYLETVYGLLFKNEKKYYIKRNKFLINNNTRLIRKKEKLFQDNKHRLININQ